MRSGIVELAAALVAVFEGERLKAYRDSGGVWTIGFGHTGTDVYEGLAWTHDQAVEAMAADTEDLCAHVDSLHPLAAAAYVSFGYNCGAGALRRVLSGTADMGTFIHDRKGNTLPGLVSRRRLEKLLAELGAT